MKRKRLVSIFIIIILGIICVGSIFCHRSPHIQIKLENVSQVIVYDSIKYHEMNQSEINDFVSWYNECYDIRINRDFTGTVTLMGRIIINLKDGGGASIMLSGNDFEIQAYNPEKQKNISYWARQKNIENLLRSLDNGQ